MGLDYYPFGQTMPGRNWISTVGGYRYSHNGHEKENEIFEGAQSAEFWMYDSRLGRRWERDPIVKPWESPYATFANNPIYYSDPLGLDAIGQKEANAGKGKVGDTYTDNNGRTFENKGGFEGWQEKVGSESQAASSLQSNPTSPENLRAITNYGSGSNIERTESHAEFTVQSVSGGGGFSVGVEGTFKEFNFGSNYHTKNFLYPNEQFGIWELDGKGGTVGAGVSLKFGTGVLFDPDPWKPYSQQVMDINDFDIEGTVGLLTMSSTNQVDFEVNRLQYNMLGVSFGAKFKYESPIPFEVGAGFSGIVYTNLKPATIRDSMRTSAAFPNHPISKAFNARLATLKSKFLD